MPERANRIRFSFIIASLVLVGASSTLAQWRRPELVQKDFLTLGNYSQIIAITATDRQAYFASLSGILRYDIINETWLEPLDFSGLQFGAIYRLAASFDDEKLWMETDLDVYLYERIFGYWSRVGEFPSYEISGEYIKPELVHPAPIDFFYFPDGTLVDSWGRVFPTHPIFRDRSGYLWMGVQGYGPARSEIDGGYIELLPFGLLQTWISSLAIVDGRLLVGGVVDGSARIGLTVMDRSSGEFEYIEQGLELNFPQTDVLSLGKSEESILVGTDLGLFEIDRQTRTKIIGYDRFSGLPHTRVNTAVGVGDTTLVGSRSGLAMIFPDSTGAREVARHALGFTEIYCLEPAYFKPRREVKLGKNIRPRHVWMGAETGAYRIDMQTLKLKRLNDPEGVLDSPVRHIRMVGQNLWLLADNGLVRVGLQSGEVKTFPEINGYSGHTSLAVNGALVAVGLTSGLIIMDYRNKQPLTHRFTTFDGLPSDNITSLLFDGDYLWIGTDRGLGRFWWANPSRVY